MITPLPFIQPRRFWELREQAKLTPAEMAARLRVTGQSLEDLEQCEDEWRGCFSPAQLACYCRTVGIAPATLFGSSTAPGSISPADFARRIREHCARQHLTLDEFEERVGWRVHQSLENPSRLLEEMSMDGLGWVCRELDLDWRAVLEGL